MSDDTLTALVKELRPERESGGVIVEIERRWHRQLTMRERRTVIEMCSRYANWGSTQYVASPPSPAIVSVQDDVKKIYKLHAAEGRRAVHELMGCVLEKVAIEDLIDVLCPPFGSV